MDCNWFKFSPVLCCGMMGRVKVVLGDEIRVRSVPFDQMTRDRVLMCVKDVCPDLPQSLPLSIWNPHQNEWQRLLDGEDGNHMIQSCTNTSMNPPVVKVKPDTDADDRVIKVLETSSRFDVGKVIGQRTRDKILQLYQRKRQIYVKHLDLWEKLTIAAKENTRRYCPQTFHEMCGIVEGSGLDESVIFALACEYEMLMCAADTDATLKAKLGHCTGFACIYDRLSLCGQNNDEPKEDWFDGLFDIVVLTDWEMYYTHPGYGAYMGMNKAGVCVLWQYVDNGERNLEGGVPTNSLIREALKFRSVDEAVDFLRSCPLTVPNNFMVHSRAKTVNLEVSPTHFTALELVKGDYCHSNHFVYDQDMVDNDVGINNPGTTTVERLKTMRKLVRENRPEITEEKGASFLQTPPIHNKKTLASMVFNPRTLTMKIVFANGDSRDLRLWHPM